MTHQQPSPVLVLVGPTAIGKTAVALALVELLWGRAEIVSADSVQVYRKLDIGSAKPTMGERSLAAFHAIDIVEPDEDFTVADYQRVACEAIKSINARGNLPILCGGTGLYVKALTQPMGIPRAAPDEAFRKQWMDYLEKNGPGSLHKVLSERDPDSAAKLHVNDARRIIRALEVLETTGTPLSEWHRHDVEQGLALVSPCVFVGLTGDRAWLIERIDRRVGAMVEAGFASEVQSLRDLGYDENLKSMQSLGYKELNAVFSGQTTLPEAIEAVKLHTRQYARRQMIWFRAEKRINWVNVDDRDPREIALEISARFNLQASVI
jgi:tRNA dimethylallyltransferase